MTELSAENREYWIRTTGELTPVIEAKLRAIREHALQNGYDADHASVTYEDRFGCGDIFNNRIVRYRVPRRLNGVLRRYTVRAFTYQESYYDWTDEETALQQEREHSSFLGRMNELSDDEMVRMFGKGNTPNRDYLSARPQELEFRAEDWPPPADAGSDRS